MKRVQFTEHRDVAGAARLVNEVVTRGGVAMVPTETFYGLAADPGSRPGIARACQLKGRPSGLGLPVLCSDWQQLEKLVAVPERYRVRLSRIWPGALTAVLPCREKLPAARADTLAVRIPDHDMLRTLLYLSGPLTGTSANRHDAAPCREVDRALASLVTEPELVLDGGTTAGDRPSTVVDLTGEQPKVLRPGAFGWEEDFPWERELGPA